jgi:electron transfer flavoprotein beta subunit
MKIAVCIKQVVTREWQLRINDGKSWIRDQDASFELNEPDAYALEEALRLKEKHTGEVVVVSAGPARAAQVIREALARGADRAIHIEADALATADAVSVADAIASAIREEKVDLVLTGLQSDDQGFGQVGVILAEKLGMPHATIIMEVQASPSTGSGQAPSTSSGQAAPSTGSGQGSLRVKRELEGGWFQWISLPMPALLTIQSGINQLRYATLKGIMAAKKKEIRKVTPSAATESTLRIVGVHFPEKSKQTQMISGSPADAAKDLVKRLRDEARVI